MGASRRFTLSRNQRITEGRDFVALKQDGRRLALGCLVLNWRPSKSPAGSRLGVVTSRTVGNAVQRNRARRLLREAFRLNRRRLATPTDLILVARASIAGRTLEQVARDLVDGFRRARLVGGEDKQLS